MAATSGESQLQRIIRDLQDAVIELSKEFKEGGEPITDDSVNLQKFSYKLEYLLQFDQKEKNTLLGNRKDYWDYFCDCLAKVKGANDGIRFVKSITELRTSLGKGRAFLRYSLVHQRLADTLQQCFMNTKVTSDWYYARSPFLNSKMSSDIVGQLYELTDVQFDLASRGYDLDAAWPAFARRTLSSLGSSAYLWKPPSRSSSMSSLVSNYLQAQEFPSSPDANSSLNVEHLESFEEMRVELDQAELRQRELQDRIHQLEMENQELQAAVRLQKEQVQVEKEKSNNYSEENSRLTKMITELQKQCEVSHSTQSTVHDLQKCLQSLELNAVEQQKEYSTKLEQLVTSKENCASKLEVLNQELEASRALVAMKDLCIDELRAKLSAIEQKKLNLLSKFDAALEEKGQQATAHCDSALEIRALLEKLQETEKEKADMQRLNDEHVSQLKAAREELQLKEEAQKELESRYNCLTADSKEESEKLLGSLETMAKEMDALQKALTLKGKEMAELQTQVMGLLAQVGSLEKNLEEARKEKEKLEEEYGRREGALKQESQSQAEQLELQEGRLTKVSQTVRSLEEQNRKLLSEKEHLSQKVKELEEQTEQQNSAVSEMDEESRKLKAENANLQQSKNKMEGKLKNLEASKASLEAEVARLRASEKQLQSEIDDALVSVDEKEKKLRGENRQLDEDLQNARRQSQILEERLEALHSDYEELKQKEETTKESYASLEGQLKSAKQRSLQMEKSLGALKESEECLQSQLTEKEVELQGMESQCEQLRAEAERHRKKAETLEVEKLSVEKTCLHQTKLIESLTSEKESVEKHQLEQAASLAKDAKELASRLTITEEQLEVNRGEVSRLQAEVLNLQVKLQQTANESEQMRGELSITETVLGEQKALVQQLTEQIESLNRNHVQELVQCKEREEVLKKEQETAAHQKAEMENNLLNLKEELFKVKQYLEAARMENEENKDLLHRTNTDMAELGIQICALTSEKVDAEERLAQATERLKELQEQAAEQQEKLKLDTSNLRQENKSLQEKLDEAQICAAAVPNLQLQLETVKKQAQSFQETSQEELSAIKFQMSTEILNYQTKFKAVSEECGKVREQLEEQKRQQHAAEEEIAELQAANTSLSRKLDEAREQLSESESARLQKEEEVTSLRELLERIQKEADEAKEKVLDYSEKLSKVAADKNSSDQKLFAELDDLTRTKQFLEERLIELIRDKDALWQKSDALEFQQKLSAEQRWQGDTEVNHCLDCQREFSWMVRRHHCRMCGRIFCYYCCNNYMVTKPGGKKERCCRACFNKPRVIVDSTDDSGSSANQEGSPASLESPVSPSERAFVASEASKPPDDAAFDIITDEELCRVQESDSLHNESQMEGESLDQSMTDLNSTCNSSTFDESEEWQVAQDAEICLLKSGEVMIKLPLTVEEILNFGESNRELFIKSSTYSIIPITVTEMGLTISWIFSSDPKSISFSVVYQESEDTPLDQCKVLIPMTRCNSHKETVRGQVKVRNSGIYTLIFDNTFSRFISKRVFYHLAVERPVIYDGSDFP
ncbi:FYVE and coiled-coil domain-containing protein 1 isoform X1 [Falco biarmicus]|uniref:FYVE and coiled-coil domain-containing protein 1 isoform X1 n=1 Tax=Falco biarmicus TaxID=345155 RepID=UPI0024BCA8B7|nr:FYVE and coiled-coil domain-containing protein 1 isoform X1 [Falco biarmicus]XP_056192916.1 FYVE and coiled-coil domain-containing protein 1 isoform X1 [Falco biarmicus]XP_056192917.1 FYVE and coiled-coil domain-containing protein 1 isoform X1 [Falco biarmicus]XP_056192918.1 FYVE and coiled-coil domain-containing protein 1 isoform X1 [Falco biarmicus]